MRTCLQMWETMSASKKIADFVGSSLTVNPVQLFYTF